MKKKITIAAIALASAITASSAHADDIKVSGKVFFDYSKHTQTLIADKTGGTINRTYLTAKKTSMMLGLRR
ncbi:MAG: hypothetical protein R8M14_06295 [Ghiorsea sp.]